MAKQDICQVLKIFSSFLYLFAWLWWHLSLQLDFFPLFFFFFSRQHGLFKVSIFYFGWEWKEIIFGSLRCLSNREGKPGFLLYYSTRESSSNLGCEGVDGNCDLELRSHSGWMSHCFHLFVFQGFFSLVYSQLIIFSENICIW